MRRNNKKRTKISFLVILTVFTVFTWLFLDIFRALTRSSVAPVLEEEIKPLDPDLDKKILDSLRQRKEIEAQDLESIPEITEFEIETEVRGGSPSAATASAR